MVSLPPCASSQATAGAPQPRGVVNPSSCQFSRFAPAFGPLRLIRRPRVNLPPTGKAAASP
eukprot:6939835-Lingulodinium_polyedra.AAC.1